MAVYLDKSRNVFGRMIMCHMVADTEDELHEMAGRLGLRRTWFQDGASTPHYDLSQERRERALKLGAVELDRRAFVAVLRRLRETGATTWVPTLWIGLLLVSWTVSRVV